MPVDCFANARNNSMECHCEHSLECAAINRVSAYGRWIALLALAITIGCSLSCRICLILFLGGGREESLLGFTPKQESPSNGRGYNIINTQVALEAATHHLTKKGRQYRL